MKKIAIVASGWHFPISFYRSIPMQRLPKGWEIEMFCIAHREPEHAIEEKKDKVITGDRAYLDERLYPVATKEQIINYGWKFQLEPNTVGDCGNSNQWLEKNNYKDYDLLLFTHDDNLILNDSWFFDIIKDKSFKEWGILANSLGMPEGWIRGSCEFFKPWVLDKMGGKFDLSEVTLSMEGKTTVSEDRQELYDWNKTVDPLMRFIKDKEIPIGFLSPSYRVSAFCIEGERGYISNTHGLNTAKEDEGLKHLEQNGLI